MRFLAVFLLGLWPVVLLAQVPAPTLPRHHSLSLEAQSVANGGEASNKDSSKTQNGPIATTNGDAVVGQTTQLRDQHKADNRTNLRVDIRNLGATPDGARLEWYFVAMPVGDTARKVGSAEFIFDRGAQDVSVPPGMTETRAISSKVAENITVRTSTMVNGQDTGLSYADGLNVVGHTTQTGVRMQGWFVRVADNGQVIAARGSSEHYEEIANDSAKLAAFVSASAAAHAAMDKQAGHHKPSK